MTPARQEQENQKGDGPETDGDNGHDGEIMENARASRNTEDAAEEEQSANFGQAQSCDGEDIKDGVQLKHRSAGAPLSMADG